MLAQAEAVRKVVFGTPTSPVLLAFLGVVGVALIVYLYRTERRLTRPAQGRVLTVLRSLLCLLAVFVLAEPIVSTTRTETHKPWVVVLVDESTSMDIADAHLTPGRQLRLADELGMLAPDARPAHLESAAVTVQRAAGTIQTYTDHLRTLAGPADPAPRDGTDQDTPARGQRLRADLDRLLEEIERAASDVAAARAHEQRLPASMRPLLAKITQRLDRDVLPPLRTFAERLAAPEASAQPTSRPAEALARSVARAGDALYESADRLVELAAALDEGLADHADEATRKAMAAASQQLRRQVAARLLHPVDGPLVPSFRDAVHLRSYRFSSTPREVPLAQSVIEMARGPGEAASQPARDDRSRNRTDLAAALEAAAQDLAGQTIAGVIVATDGQHNTDRDVVAAAERFAAAGVPVFPLMLGTVQRPTDAAIVEVDTPSAVFVEDRAEITASVQLDGLVGKAVTVRLLDADGNVVGEETLTPVSPHERREVAFSDTPHEQGRIVYRLEIEPQAGEVLTDNNRRTIAIDITDEGTKVLVVDDGPRWEFRYVRNLLLRDKSVKLQYLLFDPAYVEKEPVPRTTVAKASNANPEADVLPEKSEDLNAFDVIVLGDVDPGNLGPDHQRRLEQFVSDRGGTLVVVAGKQHMPAGYAGRPLADLIPVTERAAARTVATAGAPGRTVESFHLTLTAEGRASRIVRLHIETEANVEAWQRLPQVYWGSPWRQAKGGATVLVYADHVRAAVGPDAPDGASANGHSDADLQRANAMICVQNYGLGKVLYIGWDATWRLRYKTGDALHHKLWGQILRWATEGKLPAGLKLVKIGTDRARYDESEPVTVRAKFSKPDLTPMTDALVSAELRAAGKVVRTGWLHFVSGSPGIYEATFTDLPRGELTVALKSPQIDGLRQPDDPPGDVTTEIVIDAAESPESLNLAANEALLARLAEVSDGVPITPADLRPFLARLHTDPVHKTHTRQTRLWDSWWLMLAFVLIVTLEWVLRKRAGLV